MGSFDRSYYDILSKYQDIVKEGMNVQPTYFKKVGDTYVQIKDNMELARTNPAEIFVPTGDPNNPYKSYTEQEASPQPSISMTGNSGPETAVTTTGGNRVQYPTQITPQASNQQAPSNTTSSTSTATNSTQPKPATKATTTRIAPKPATKAVTSSGVR